jgi:hypothetical protein
VSDAAIVRILRPLAGTRSARAPPPRDLKVDLGQVDPHALQAVVTPRMVRQREINPPCKVVRMTSGAASHLFDGAAVAQGVVERGSQGITNEP